MNLNQLQYFVTLAHIEHYTRAAEKLTITQPSLSHAISSLEQELGTRLFERQGRNVVLTVWQNVYAVCRRSPCYSGYRRAEDEGHDESDRGKD